MTQSNRILIIAGPNGAGKTTFAREFLIDDAQTPVFINADLIAAGLNPFEPEKVAVQAGRLMLRMTAIWSIKERASRSRPHSVDVGSLG